MATQAATELAFSCQGIRAGARRGLPVALANVAFGVAFGALAREAGLSGAEALAMSGLVFAGASQMVAIGLWSSALPVIPILAATLAVNLRHVLMGIGLHRWFRAMSAGTVAGAAFFLTDESWALTVNELETGRRDGAFLVGSGLALWLSFFTGTAAGTALGAVLEDPSRFGLDFVYLAVLLAVLPGFWRGRSSLVSWPVAAIGAVVAALSFGGSWYVLIGGGAGAVLGGLFDAE